MKDQIFKERGITVIEKNLSIHEVINAYHEDRLLEMFGGSTSNFIQPIRLLAYKDESLEMGE